MANRHVFKSETVRWAALLGLVATFTFGQVETSEARRRTRDQQIAIMKREPVAVSQKCVIEGVHSKAQADAILKAYKIQTHGARAEERLALAKGLNQATALNGGVFKPATNTKFVFECRSGASRQTRWGIEMNRCSGGRSHSCNGPHMLHELAHKIGNSRYPNGGTYYTRYSERVGKCHFSNYGTKNRNEQFAEAFTAFLTHPELLSKGSDACQRAYSFFADQVFKKNGRLASCDRRKRETLLALHSGEAKEPDIQVATVGRHVPVRATASLPKTFQENVRYGNFNKTDLIENVGAYRQNANINKRVNRSFAVR